MDFMRIFISARETAIQDYIQQLSREPDSDDLDTKRRIAEETGLDLFSFSDWEIQHIEEEVRKLK